jgi:hypothetical protein
MRKCRRASEGVEDPGEADEVFLQSIESFVGRCDCGGRYDPYAPIRCPQCRSTAVEKTFVNKYD